MATSCLTKYRAQKVADIGQLGIYDIDTELLMHRIHGNVSDSIDPDLDFRRNPFSNLRKICGGQSQNYEWLLFFLMLNKIHWFILSACNQNAQSGFESFIYFLHANNMPDQRKYCEIICKKYAWAFSEIHWCHVCQHDSDAYNLIHLCLFFLSMIPTYFFFYF